jgi:methionyl aminopeptidase
MTSSEHINEIIELKTASEIDLMQQAGKILHEVLAEVLENVAPGVTTGELDNLAEARIREAGCIPAFLGYRGYPATLCTSINEEVVHGIPSPERMLLNGDILSLDVGLIKDGFFADTAATIGVGDIDDTAKRLIDVTRISLDNGIQQACVGNRLGDISHAIQEYVEKHDFSVVREYSGHGIGRQLHEPPQLLNFGKAGSGPRLCAGMAIAIEPMVNEGTWRTKVLSDKWTVTTADKKRSAHFEHTIVITESGPLVMT